MAPGVNCHRGGRARGRRGPAERDAHRKLDWTCLGTRERPPSPLAPSSQPSTASPAHHATCASSEQPATTPPTWGRTTPDRGDIRSGPSRDIRLRLAPSRGDNRQRRVECRCCRCLARLMDREGNNPPVLAGSGHSRQRLTQSAAPRRGCSYSWGRREGGTIGLCGAAGAELEAGPETGPMSSALRGCLSPDSRPRRRAATSNRFPRDHRRWLTSRSSMPCRQSAFALSRASRGPSRGPLPRSDQVPETEISWSLGYSPQLARPRARDRARPSEWSAPPDRRATPTSTRVSRSR